MIITAGKLKGRKVKTVKSQAVRPTSSKIRESIFNIVQLSPNGTTFYDGETCFLDLFAGSGIMGLEAYSRGAEEIVFIEKDNVAAKNLKQNLCLIEDKNKFKFITGDAVKVLSRFNENRFNFIFIDPPYAAELYEPVLKKINTNKLLKEEGFIVLEHDSEHDFTEIIVNNGFNLYKSKTYGDTTITIITT